MGQLVALLLITACDCSASRGDPARDDAGPDPMDAGRDDAPPAPDTRPSLDAPIAPDTAADATDAGCGTGFALRGVAPNVLIAMPRSCYSLFPWDASTGDQYEATDPRSVWARAVAGVHEF